MAGFVKLTTPLGAGQAQPVLAALQKAGMEAYAHNEQLVGVLSGQMSVSDGFPIYVRADQRAEAEAYLRRAGLDADSLACPRCGGSTRAVAGRTARIGTRLRQIAGLPPALAARECVECWHGWYPGSRKPFTHQELGYNPDAPLIDWRAMEKNFKAFLAWTRSIGYHDPSRSDDDREPPR
ncbi:hypothetical protein [Marinicauda sp. Alg238-R41]|uniref:hypothetical protein n=1 Tax=Marinicauda sp. Alg238-R41 TaxID=2993447 RepID=UPI0022E08C3A|nr:hypothetical protein [Marinicauda sp. Alg238-R41]